MNVRPAARRRLSVRPAARRGLSVRTQQKEGSFSHCDKLTGVDDHQARNPVRVKILTKEVLTLYLRFCMYSKICTGDYHINAVLFQNRSKLPTFSL
jgi:hypothetical protein